MWSQASRVAIPAIVLWVTGWSDDAEPASTSDNEHEEEEEQDGELNGATCPDEDPPTYETFGEEFLDKYCMDGYASSLTGAARRNAPVDHNFRYAGERSRVCQTHRWGRRCRSGCNEYRDATERAASFGRRTQPNSGNGWRVLLPVQKTIDAADIGFVR